MPLIDVDFYDFGPFRLTTGDKTLRRDGVEIPLTPKLYDLLGVLVANAVAGGAWGPIAAFC